MNAEAAARDAEHIRPYLEDDEQILWVGRPDLRQSMGYELCRIGKFLVFLTGLALVSIVFVLVTSGYLFLFESPLVRGAMIGAAIIFLASLPLILWFLWLVLQWSTAQSVYAITNRSFLLMRPPLWPLPSNELLVRRFSLQEVYDLQIATHRNGFGTVIFLGVWLPTLPRKGWIPQHPAFRAIPDVDRVIAIARTAAQKSGFAEQPKPPLRRQILQILQEEIWLYAIASILITVFSIAITVDVVGSNAPPDIGFILNRQFIIASAIMCVALVGLIWSFRVRETLRRYPHLRHWQIVLIVSQTGLLSIWFGAMCWVGLELR